MMSIELTELRVGTTTAQWHCRIKTAERRNEDIQPSPVIVGSAIIASATADKPEEAVAKAIDALQLQVANLIERARKSGLLSPTHKEGPYR